MTTNNKQDEKIVCSIGQFFSCKFLEDSTEENILQLVQISPYTFNLIDIKTGNRWVDKPFHFEPTVKDWNNNIPFSLVETLINDVYQLRSITTQEVVSKLLKA